MSGLEPGDVQVCEVHDCFSIAEIIHLEDLGFFPPGHGYRAVAEGKNPPAMRIQAHKHLRRPQVQRTPGGGHRGLPGGGDLASVARRGRESARCPCRACGWGPPTTWAAPAAPAPSPSLKGDRSCPTCLSATHPFKGHLDQGRLMGCRCNSCHELYTPAPAPVPHLPPRLGWSGWPCPAKGRLCAFHRHHRASARPQAGRL